MSDAPASELTLKGREIIVAVCGGIAAYKVADVVSKLVHPGAGFRVGIKKGATHFAPPLTFEALSGRKVRSDTFDLAATPDPQPTALPERSDLMLAAPATA